ncbi:MAG: SapC family protein [Gammaproteobacteria bacterium]|nr:SapC family protein [Gammaproteobacteria bacterium]
MNSQPPGYRQLVAFDRNRHSGHAVARGAARFARELAWIHLTKPEFARAARHLPIAFAPDSNGNIVPVVVTGVTAGQNLLMNGDDWPAGIYCPAYIRRYPFLLAARTHHPDEEPSVVCVDETALVAADHDVLMKPGGVPTAAWQAVETMLRQSAAAERATRQFCHTLENFQLLEEFHAVLSPLNGSELRLPKMWRIDEARLRRLPAERVRELLLDGSLAAIHAHLLSLENFSVLLDRYAVPRH